MLALRAAYIFTALVFLIGSASARDGLDSTSGRGDHGELARDEVLTDDATVRILHLHLLLHSFLTSYLCVSRLGQLAAR